MNSDSYNPFPEAIMEDSYLMGGSRTKGFMKDDPDTGPLVTVITVVRNGQLYIEETIQSVLNQSYDNLEYIIIDGDSTDGTLDIIRRYEDGIDLWISQPDTGIYQAMNKGVRLAAGRYLHFLNADDHYTDIRVIERIVGGFRDSGASLIFGDVLMLNKKKGTAWIRHSDVHPLYFMFKGIPQQAFFYKKELFERYGMFDESLRIVADLEFYLRLTRKYYIFTKYIRMIVVVFNAGSVSSDMVRKSVEREPVIEKYYSPAIRFFFKNWFFCRLMTRNEQTYSFPSLPERLLRRFLSFRLIPGKLKIKR